VRYLVQIAVALSLLLAACEAPAPTEFETDEGPVALFSRSAAWCDNLAGSIEASFVDNPDWDIEADLFDTAGNPVGHGFAWIDDLDPRGEGSIHVDMRHQYVIGGSSLLTRDQGVLSPEAPPLYRFNNRLEVVGGDGDFAGATGVLRAHGTVDLGSGEIHLDYHGRVCR
jgi:hypothetical protein